MLAQLTASAFNQLRQYANGRTVLLRGPTVLQCFSTGVPPMVSKGSARPPGFS